jgi:hypothetical protein
MILGYLSFYLDCAKVEDADRFFLIYDRIKNLN